MENQKLTLPLMVRFTYEKRGPNFFGAAEVPTKSGTARFEMLLPVKDVEKEVTKFLTSKHDVSGDGLNLIGNVPRIVQNVANDRLKRRLGTAIKVRFGGTVMPYEVSGPAGFGVRMSSIAAAKRRYRVAGNVAGDEVGVSLKGIVKGAAKGIGKGAKAIGKGTKAVAKGTAKGAVKVVKGGAKVATGLTNNPITSAALSFVPGGDAAMAIVKAAQAGSPGANQAISQLNTLAGQGDLRAAQAAAALAQARAKTKASQKPDVPIGAILGGAGALVGLLLLAKK